LSKKNLFLFVIILMVTGIFLRIPDITQGLQGDEQILMDRGYDLLKQLKAEKSLEGYKPCYDLKRYKYVSYSDTKFPFNIFIKAHHPGYFSTILFATFMKLSLSKKNITISDLIQLRWVQSLLLIIYVICLSLLFIYKLKLPPLIPFLFGIFILTEPAILGESRLIKQDVLLMIFLTSSIIFFYMFIKLKNESYLIFSGIFIGISWTIKLISMPFFIISLIFLIYLAIKNKNILLPFKYIIIVYISLLMFSPNIWSSPIGGLYDMLKIAKDSPQVPKELIPFSSNIYYFLRIFSHISVLYIIFFIFSLISLFKHPDIWNKYIFINILVMFILNFMIYIKCPRYIIGVIPITLVLSFDFLNYLEIRSGKKILLILISLTFIVHMFNFISFYPYHSSYTWEFLKIEPVAPYERLDRTIMLPQIAEYLENNNIKEVKVLTGDFLLQYYYSGKALPLKDWSGEWLLVSQKYFNQIPSELTCPYKIFKFKGQEIYRLYRKQGL